MQYKLNEAGKEHVQKIFGTFRKLLRIWDNRATDNSEEFGVEKKSLKDLTYDFESETLRKIEDHPVPKEFIQIDEEDFSKELENVAKDIEAKTTERKIRRTISNILEIGIKDAEQMGEEYKKKRKKLKKIILDETILLREQITDDLLVEVQTIADYHEQSKKAENISLAEGEDKLMWDLETLLTAIEPKSPVRRYIFIEDCGESVLLGEEFSELLKRTGIEFVEECVGQGDFEGPSADSQRLLIDVFQPDLDKKLLEAIRLVPVIKVEIIAEEFKLDIRALLEKVAKENKIEAVFRGRGGDGAERSGGQNYK